MSDEQEIPLEGKKKSPILPILAIIVVILVLVTAIYVTTSDDENTLFLATTTSTANSGLLDEIIPAFEDEYDCVVKITPVGTGQALELGRNGDADVLLVHAPEDEIEFVKDGYGTERTLVMYNEFVIIGHEDDPADIEGESKAADALKKIYESESEFASRGDNSGTHKKEISLWEEAGLDYVSDIDIPDNDWYKSVSAGMGDTLTRANDFKAYTITDEGTFFAYEADLDLVTLVKGDESLFNQYSVIPVNPEKHPHVKIDLAEDFVDWITSDDVQDMIGEFEANGKQLFTPNALGNGET